MKLKHVALYAKGWYKKSDDIFLDLMKCLEADDYTPYTNDDVVQILMSNIFPWMSQQQENVYSFRTVLEEISPNECSKIGYYTKNWWLATSKEKEALPEWNYWTAVVHALLSKVRYAETEKLGGLPEPDYSILPKSRNVEVTEEEQEMADYATSKATEQ